MRRAVVQIIFSLLCLFAQAQKVSNIRAEQRGQDIVVLYSLETTSPCEVSLLLSQDNGATWSKPLENVSGDVGKNIAAGEKEITWKVLEEREQLVGDKIKFKVVAISKKKIESGRFFIEGGEVSDYIKASKIQLDLGQDSLAILYLESAISLFPDYTDGYNEIAVIYTNRAIASKGKENEALRIKLYGKAADWYEKKMFKLGENAKDLFIQGQMYYFSQQYVLSDITFRKSSERYPEAWFWVAKCQNKIDLAAVTETNPAKGLAKPFYEKGIVLIGQDPAIIEKNKKNLAEAYQYLGLYYGSTGDINCSKTAWNKVLQLDPTNKLANQLLVTPETLDRELVEARGNCKLVEFP